MRAPIKSLLAVALAGMTGMIAGSALAADGSIKFTGEITSASCVVTSVGGGSGLLPGNNIIVPLGMVSLSSLGNTPGANLVGSRSVDINLDCTGTGHMSILTMRFNPHEGSGLAPGGFLGIESGPSAAQGVAVAIYNGNTLLDLGSNASVTTNILRSETTPAERHATFTLRAGFVSTQATPVAGIAHATLPFSLIYN